MFIYKHFIFNLLAIVIFMAPMFSSLIAQDGEILGMTGNQAAFVFCTVFGSLFFLRIALFYTRHFNTLDFFLVCFIFFYFIGLSEISFESTSNIYRLIVCFYVVPYFFSYYRSLRQDEKIFWLYLVGLSLLIALSLLFSEFKSGRFVVVGHANITSQNFLAFWLLLFLAYGLTRHPVNSLIVLSVHVLVTLIIILTLSRQAFLGMMIFIFIYFYQDYFKKIKINKKIIIVFVLVLFLSLIIFFARVYLDNAERIFSLESYTGFFEDSRFMLWIYYLSYMESNVGDLLFSGFDPSVLNHFYLHDVNFILNAPHNFLLAFVVLSGIVSTLIFLLVVFGCIRKGIILYKCGFYFPIAVFITVLALAFVDNFFSETTRNLSYLFWITAGMSANYLRLNIHLHHSGKGHY